MAVLVLHGCVTEKLDFCESPAGLTLQGIMGKEQELLQAIKNGDLPSTQKLLARVKGNRNSKYIIFVWNINSETVYTLYINLSLIKSFCLN